MGTWVSSDKSKPYYGQTVTTTSEGKIVPANQVITVGTNTQGQTTYTTSSGHSTTNQAAAVNEAMNVLNPKTASVEEYKITLPRKGTWISQDKSKDYYGKEVTVVGGRIRPVDQVNISVPLAAKMKDISFYSDPTTGELYGDPSEIPQAKSSQGGIYTVTRQGAVYSDTGQRVSEAQANDLRSKAFSYLAPAEQFIGSQYEFNVFGSKWKAGLNLGDPETVYQNVVKTKLALQTEKETLNQQIYRKGGNLYDLGGMWKDPVLRGRQMFAEAKSAGFELVSAPIETTALTLGMKTLPTGSGGSFGMIQSTATGTGFISVLGIARNPEDPGLGIAATIGEAAVLQGYSSSLDLVGGKNIPKWGTEDIKYKSYAAEKYSGSRYSAGEWKDISTSKLPGQVRVSQSLIPETPAYKGLKFGEQDLIGVEYTGGKGKLRLGSPKFSLTQSEIKGLDVYGYVPATSKTEARFAQNLAENLYGEHEYGKSRIITNLISETEITRSLERGKLFPKRVISLSEEGTSNVKSFARKEDALVYGSFSAEPQLPQKNSLGILRGAQKGEIFIKDIDLQLKVGDEAAQARTKNLLNLLSTTDTVRISKQSPTLIESKVNGKWVHAVDIHSIDAPLDTNLPTEGAWGFKFDKSGYIRVENLRTMPLSETRTRKAASILTFREKGFAPEPHRMKDIADYITTQEYLTTIRNPTDLPKIQELKMLYSKELAAFQPSKVPLMSPSGSSVTSVSPDTFPTGFGRAIWSSEDYYSMKQAQVQSPGVVKSVEVKPRINLKAIEASPSIAPTGSRSLYMSGSPFRSISPSFGSGSKSGSTSPSPRSPYRISPSISPSKSLSPSVSLPSVSLSPSSASASTSPYSSPSASISPSASPGSIISTQIATPPAYNWLLPGVGLPQQYFQQGKGKTVKFKPKYFASLEAVTFGIKGRKPTTRELMTGLNVRPMLRR